MSAQTVSYKKYVAGWLDSSIHHFLEVFSEIDESAKYALITCIDSNANVASLRKTSPELKASKILISKARTLGTGLLLPTEVLREVNSQRRIFFGFDEVWFFPSDQIRPKPDSARLVGPYRINQTELNKFGEWMLHCSCSLALGDGEGLNFIVKSHGLARCLLGHSLAQAEPAVMPFETEPPDSA